MTLKTATLERHFPLSRNVPKNFSAGPIARNRMVRRRLVLMTPGHFDRMAFKTYDSSFRLSSLECTGYAEENAERKRGDSSVVLRCIPMAIQAQSWLRHPGFLEKRLVHFPR